MKKKDYINLSILLLILITIIIIITGNNIYGSKTDWLHQHFAIPEYFRNLFYKTGNLFPNFAPNIGAGQNIFNLAYYGLLSPIILFSYLLPFISMKDYIIISSIISIIVSTYLIYKWLKNNNFSSTICFISSALFLLSGPIIFHSHRHIMFINYFPFLLMALIGIDKYITKKKSLTLILGIFLMIMTNYFYSVAGLITIGIYAIYKLLQTKDFKIKIFSKELLSIIIRILLGVLLASIILLPIIYTIISSRSSSSIDKTILELLTPNLDLNILLSGPNGVGLSLISIFALLYSFISKKKENIFISTTIFIIFFIPVFMYLLNGGLYIRSKALIPLLPILILSISIFFNKLFKKEINLKVLLGLQIIFNIICYINGYNEINYYIGSLILIILIIIYNKFNKKIIIYLPLILVSIITTILINNTDEFVTKNEYNEYFNEDKTELINNVLENDKDFYRFSDLTYPLYTINKIYNTNYYQTSLYSSTYNSDYYNNIKNDFNKAIKYRNNLIQEQSSNIMIDTYMGTKYVINKENTMIGYTKYKTNNDYTVYKNNNVFSLGFLNQNTISKSDYDKLKFPYKSEALLNNIVTNKTNNYKTNIKEYKLDYELDNTSNIDIEKTEKGYNINTKKTSKINLKLNNKLKNQILFIKFKMKYNQNCSSGDTSIIINKVENKLTCKQWMYHNQNNEFEYTISSDEISNLEIEFSKGKFLIEDIETYTLDYKYVLEANNNITKLKNITINNDTITGIINNKVSGNVVFTIPYDKGFNIKVNDKEVKYSNLNNGYIGIYLNKGNNKISIKYNSPYFKEGKIISLISLISLIVLIIYEKKK